MSIGVSSVNMRLVCAVPVFTFIYCPPQSKSSLPASETSKHKKPKQTNHSSYSPPDDVAAITLSWYIFEEMHISYIAAIQPMLRPATSFRGAGSWC